ncbi:Carboxymuconolactone decarboxylase family protein [Gemmata obscuriglobus]|uniref:Alkylhydroperoxidase n=2 Tax=Gemmata TaxID=113 RepID=A0A2Z3GYQ2_9BACT|nr:MULTISPECIES: carboxymuconolactone decarboxylase family protein [Gemmata]AWM38893.1 alkylhydroperoxidase [Gemmata obscuriglobus]MDY3556764.1 carboxymuconolactone decarboxylase family protein [Gemmata algarum]MDY3560311.1 carboxymuconolactone decarboxylase family protein [Gemmata algarum]QEG28105.1 Carboxymuconolactone decarboxylase family protein [Gemmata obscuriglobus]VTS05743.1 alkylhydroperoxidase : Alkyl hydroperoxide reductase AhpD OS=Burkholderia terrae BS001 GN=WQE_07612 PE=4 SV=1: C
MYDPAQMKKLKTMRELAPEGMAAFDALNAAVFKDGALSLKVKELIAVAVAVTTQCPYCIDAHVKKAKAAGATDAELTEATLVAAALRAGGAVTHGTHAIS